MNIQDARIQIEHAIRIYLKKDANGHYRIPINRQRPIFLIGAPGIGKTAIMSQIAAKLEIALVSYSMTHHTRQSALGLPVIREKTYDGVTVSVSEYTMSDIIATIYDTIAETGMQEGILFLDEINCVSETLAPSMLQFLQYKVFGRHQVPPGWVIVTAGNPPAYNRTVREFDIATLDRLRVIEVEADYGAWRDYARANGVHSAVLGFLDLKKSYFHHIETTVDGKRYVTARGWEDLSDTLKLYEDEGLPVSGALVDPIIRQPKIAREFTAYYDLHTLYAHTYRIPDILQGQAPPEVLERARSAPFDERLSLIGLLTGAIQRDAATYCQMADALALLQTTLLPLKEKYGTQGSLATDCLEGPIEQMAIWLARHAVANHGASAAVLSHQTVHDVLSEWAVQIVALSEEKRNWSFIETAFTERVHAWERLATTISTRLDNLYDFAEGAFAGGDAMLILTTELAVNVHSATFIAERGCAPYARYQDLLALEDRETELLAHVKDFLL